MQALLKDKTQPRRSETNSTGQHILTGLVFDETGDRLSPTHANKRGQLYRYYISHRLMEAHRTEKDGWRLPSHALEEAVLAGLNRFLTNKPQVIDLIQLSGASLNQIRWINGEIERVSHLLNDGSSSAEQRALLSRFLTRIDFGPEQLRITFDVRKLRMLLLAKRSDRRTWKQTEFAQALHILTVPFVFRRRGVETKLVMDSVMESEREPDMALVRLVAKAYRWFQLMATGEVESMEVLASRDNADVNEISRILQLAFLAPDVVEMISQGRQPLGLTLMKLKRISYLPFGWSDQRVSLQL